MSAFSMLHERHSAQRGIWLPDRHLLKGRRQSRKPLIAGHPGCVQVSDGSPANKNADTNVRQSPWCFMFRIGTCVAGICLCR
jgi:hypothetical protein